MLNVEGMFSRRAVQSSVWGIVLGFSCVAPAAHAVSDEERAGARAAANQGVEAFNQQHWAEAVELFSRAEELVHSPVHLSFIARAELKLGHWVKAYEIFNRVKRDPLPNNPSKVLTQAVDDASKQLEELETQLPYVDIKIVGASDKDVSVTMDGEAVASALVGVLRPIDPGSHVFQASGKVGGSDPLKADFKASEHKSIELVIKPNLATAPAPEAPVAPPAAATAINTEPASEPDANNGSGLRTGGYTALGVGVAGVALGTVFLLGSKSKQDDSDSAYQACGGALCPASSQGHIRSLDSDVAHDKTLALVSYSVGGAAIATGVTLLVLSGKHSSPQSGSLTPWLSYNSVGLEGAF